MSSRPDYSPVIYGCAGPVLSDDEKALFADCRPLGLIVFRRNIQDKRQLADLTHEFRGVVGRQDAPVLIDQEGGRVARLGPPHWRKPPPGARFADLFARDEAAGVEALRLNFRLIAADLHAVGIDVDCAPVLDLLIPAAHDIIGDRAYGATPDQVARLGRVVCEALLAGGVLPIVKHIPGHGRARADSHVELPRVDAPLAALEADFAPFRALADQPIAMTAHIVYAAIDPDRPASTSAKLVADIIRRDIGFQGFLLSDDINMEALAGDLPTRGQACLAAGCDAILHCSGKFVEMAAVAARLPETTPAAAARIAAALARRRPPDAFDPAAGLARLEALLGAS